MKKNFTPEDELLFLALGGSGEIGMNVNLYGCQGKWLMVDLGMSFGANEYPGTELMFADPEFIEERLDDLLGIVLTHAHEDHIGALGHLWSRLRAPVHCRSFTADIARRKMDEQGQNPEDVQIAAPWPETVTAGPFTVGFMPISHSIPESSALVIDTPAGRVLHTGDFKIDETPIVGEAFDRDLIREIAKPGVRALVCDSTNVFSAHAGRSESSVGPEIEKLIAAQPGMVVATTFASNVARVKTLAEAGRAAGRSVCLLGRAMRRMIETSVRTGVVTDFPSTVTHEEAREIPRDHLMLIVTGSQGGRRAASAQLARGKYLGLKMEEGDTFLFSSKTIPGNERGVIAVMNAYSEMGVDVVDDDGGKYHVSGHANRPDLETLHGLLKPQILVPMHGEHRHLRAHAALGEARGIASVVAPNGTMVSLSGNRPEIVEHIESGRSYLDGNQLIGAMDGIVRDRIRMAINGHVAVSLILDENDALLGSAWVETHGLPEKAGAHDLAEFIEEGLDYQLDKATRKILSNDDAVEELVRRAVRKIGKDVLGKKPECKVMISRLSP